MRRLNCSITGCDRPAEYALYAETVESPDGTDDIEDRVHSTHFVQVYAIHCRAVNRRLLLSDRCECFVSAGLHTFWRRRLGNDFPDLLEMPTVRLRWDLEIDLFARDISATDIANVNGDAI